MRNLPMSLSAATASSPNPWLQVLDALEKKVNRLSYETWLKPTRFDHAQGNKIFVRVPTPEFRLIGEKYADLIQEALDGLGLAFEDVEFVTDEPAAEPPMRHDGGFPPQSASTAPPSRGQQARFDWDGAAQLNPKYIFENLVTGPGNQVANAA